MASKKDHVTPKSVEKELDKISTELITRAAARVRAAGEGVMVVSCGKSSFHMILGRASVPLCGIREAYHRPRFPKTLRAQTAHAILIANSMCLGCQQRYYALLRKAVDIEIAKL